MNPWGSPALRRTAAAGTPSSSNLRNMLPETRKCLFIGSLGFERCHVNREAVLHVGFEQSLVSFVDFLNWDDFHIGGDLFFSPAARHLLGLRASAHRWTR